MSFDVQSIKPGEYSQYPVKNGTQRNAEGGKRLNTSGIHANSPQEGLVSIVTVCRNSAQTIRKCIESVFRQSYNNIEHIIIDGKSSDSTISIIQEYADNIEYYVSEDDKGIYNAMNKGIQLSRGEYIIFLNADDWYEDSCILELVEAIKYGDCDFVTAQAIYRDDKGNYVETLRQMSYDESIYIRMPLRHETMLIPSSIYSTIGCYNEVYKILGDSDFAIRLFEAGYVNCEIPKGLLNFCITGISNTNSEQRARERKMLLFNYLPFLNSEDIDLLCYPHKLTPDLIQALINSYATELKFCRAILAIYQEKFHNLSKQEIWISSLINFPRFGLNNICISVIIPFYNSGKGILATIESVLNQNFYYGQIECICVDDNSNDCSSAIVQSLSKKDNRVKYIKNQSNIGQGPSRNRGKAKANGKWIFFLDSDDFIPQGALSHLYELGEKNNSDIVRGAFLMEQSTVGNHRSKPTKKSFSQNKEIIHNTTLRDSPHLISSTEGHWACLYDSKLARYFNYPDLRMGQDSIFLIRVLAKARRICVTNQVIYHYQKNASSVMNSLNYRKYMASVAWRLRSYHCLKYIFSKENAQKFIKIYWNDEFFKSIANYVSESDIKIFLKSLAFALLSCKVDKAALMLIKHKRPFLHAFFMLLINQLFDEAFFLLSHSSKNLRIATLSTRDHGGAGIGSKRRVKYLKQYGISAQLFSLFKKEQSTNLLKAPSALSEEEKHSLWSKVSLSRKSHPGLKASEMFSTTFSIINFKQNANTFRDADIIHLHWVAGILDYPNFDFIADKPIVWTLADMNAFTGGCHYSEGCEAFKYSCQKCPLLAEGSDLAHKNWLIKREAYNKLNNLTIICPSLRLADLARSSSLFAGRKIVFIPNPMPDSFLPSNKIAARIRLGLPTDKKLVLFGADNQTNKRKGGDILASSLKIMQHKNQTLNVECIAFGSNNFETCVPFHNMGRIENEAHLSLIYAAADCYAFPSREDNAPLTISESLISGTPVVAFDVGNVKELIIHKKNGFIARNFSPDSFAGGINHVLSNKAEYDIRNSVRLSLAAARYHDPIKAVLRHLNLYLDSIKSPICKKD